MISETVDCPVCLQGKLNEVVETGFVEAVRGKERQIAVEGLVRSICKVCEVTLVDPAQSRFNKELILAARDSC